MILGLRDLACLGQLPGCPDIYQFIFPTLLIVLVMRKGPRGLRGVEALGGIWLASFVLLVIVLQTNPLMALGYIASALGLAGATLALRR